MEPVGIDAVEVWTGKLKLDLPETFAPAKDEDPDKYRKGIGLVASSFPDLYEDIVTMGANAAKRLMERKGLTPEDIGRIDVATESAFDNSKPVSTYIAGCLEQYFDGDFRHANKKFDTLLGDADFFGSDSFTIADIIATHCIFWATDFHEISKKAQAYLARQKARPGWAASQKNR